MPKGPKGEKRPADVIGAADLENVIRQALGDALAVGRDHTGQTELAIEAVQRVRPDMTASDALAAVNLVRHE